MEKGWGNLTALKDRREEGGDMSSGRPNIDLPCVVSWAEHIRASAEAILSGTCFVCVLRINKDILLKFIKQDDEEEGKG